MKSTVMIYFFARVTSALLSFVAVVVFSRLLSPADFSLYSITLSTALLGQAFLFQWIDTCITRFYSAEPYRDRVIGVGFGLFGVTVALVVAGMGLAAAGARWLHPEWLAPDSGMDWPLVAALTAATTLALALFQQALTGLRVMNVPLRYATADVGRTLLTLGAGAALAIQGYGYLGAIGGALGAAVVMGVTAFIGQPVGFALRLPRRADLSAFLRYGAPVAATMGALMLLPISTRYVMIERVGLAEASYFIAAATLCERTIGMLMGNLRATTTPTIFADYERGDPAVLDATLRGYFIVQMLIALPLVAVFVFASDAIAVVMLGPRLGPDAARYMPLVAVAVMILGLRRAYFALSFSIVHRTFLQTVVIVPAVVIGVVATYLLIEEFGTIGGALGALVGAVVALVITVAVGFFHFRLPVPVGGTLRVLLAVVPAVPVMIWSNELPDRMQAAGALMGSAALIGLAALALNVPMTRAIATGALRKVGILRPARTRSTVTPPQPRPGAADPRHPLPSNHKGTDVPIIETAIPDVKLIRSPRLRDARGYFQVGFNTGQIPPPPDGAVFIQANTSFNAAAGTIRGLHAQATPYAQAKIVTVVRGRLRDVAVDVRRGSPSFGQWVSVDLSAEDGETLIVPRGFLHGYAALEPDTLVVYYVDNIYAPDHEMAVRFDDPDLGIDWGVPPDATIVSDKDAAAPSFADFDSPFTYIGPAAT